jgi:hypothetical protein
MSKLFTVAGTSVLEGIIKFRVANGTAAARTKVLEKNGHTEIFLQDLPKAMSKEDAMAFFSYVEGKAAAPKTVKLSTIVKKVNKEFKIKHAAPIAAPKVEMTAEELAEIKARPYPGPMYDLKRQRVWSIARRAPHTRNGRIYRLHSEQECLCSRCGLWRLLSHQSGNATTYAHHCAGSWQCGDSS